MEMIRRGIRQLLGYDSRLYRSGADLLNFIAAVKSDGFKTWRLLNDLKYGRHSGTQPLPVKLRKLNHPIFVRPNTQDAITLIDNVIRGEYDYVQTPDNSPRWMIDAGAYIGDTSAFFLSKYKDLKAIALEPNTTNYSLAETNLKPYGERAVLLNKGLFTIDGITSFSGDGTDGSIGETGVQIDCVCIASLLERFCIQKLDILKMDIEGAEENIFRSAPELWLNRIGLLIIEVHSSEIQALVHRVMNENGFRMERHRSLWFCRQK